MVKNVYSITIPYRYDENRRGNKYTLDGKHYDNNGDFLEKVYKHCLGFEPTKDKNTRFDNGNDIEQLQCSVKSSHCTLTTVQLGNSLDEILTNYYKLTPCEMVSWVMAIENSLIVYEMSLDEFMEYARTFAFYDKARKVVRFRPTNSKMLQWLEGMAI